MAAAQNRAAADGCLEVRGLTPSVDVNGPVEDRRYAVRIRTHRRPGLDIAVTEAMERDLHDQALVAQGLVVADLATASQDLDETAGRHQRNPETETGK